jgi:hypothetical protein
MDSENGGFPESGQLFMCSGHDGPELVGKLNGKYSGDNDKIIDGVRKAILESIQNQPYTFSILPLRTTNETN